LSGFKFEYILPYGEVFTYLFSHGLVVG
jgi:hypothetical protein